MPSPSPRRGTAPTSTPASREPLSPPLPSDPTLTTHRSTSLTATGALPLPLSCQSTLLNPQTNQTTCTTTSPTTIPGTLTTTTPLAPYSITDPTAPRDGCTLTSLFNPAWSFSSFVVDETKTPSAVSFDVILATQNRGYQYPITISQGAAVAGQAGWFRCEVGPDGGNGQPLWPETCVFRYDGAAGEMELKAEWKCADLDPERP